MLMQLTTATTYAGTRNSKFSNSASNIHTIQDRWNETFNSLPSFNQSIFNYSLTSAIDEFKRRHSNLKKWNDLLLVEATNAKLNSIKIDGTMQRQLNIDWVLYLLNSFSETKIQPIQVYRPDPKNLNEYLAWDGQHTLTLLWIIATKVFEEDPNNVLIPVNVYKSSLKAQMRTNFIDLSSPVGKKMLDAIDIYEQQVFGVRIDKSTNPDWLITEKKQSIIEKYNLFVTSKKFGDDDQPGAISRLQEINKIYPESLDLLCYYLSIVSKCARPILEKEIMMMSHFFDKCRINNEHCKLSVNSHLTHIPLSKKYVEELAKVNLALFNADFSPNGKFWRKAEIAYKNWHRSMNLPTSPRFGKETVHGMPFLLAQLKKSFSYPVPINTSNSEFNPDVKDLF